MAFSRFSEDGQAITAVINFSGVDLNGYEIGIDKGKYRIVFNTDDKKYGGNGKLRKKVYNTVKRSSGRKEYSFKMDIPKLTCVYLIKEN